MDKSVYRKENGNYIRRIGYPELEFYVMHVIDLEGVMQRIIYPPADVIGIIMDEAGPEVANPKVEFVYSIKQMARKYGCQRRAKKSKKFGLQAFAQLFEDEDKLKPKRIFPMMTNPGTAGGDLNIPDSVKKDLDRAMADVLEQEARKRWDEMAVNLCPCKKKQILEQIKREHEQAELEQLVLQAMIMSHDTYISMLLNQLDRSDLVLALNLSGDKRGFWTLEKKNPRLVGATLLSGKKEFWRQ